MTLKVTIFCLFCGSEWDRNIDFFVALFSIFSLPDTVNYHQIQLVNILLPGSLGIIFMIAFKNMLRKLIFLYVHEINVTMNVTYNSQYPVTDFTKKTHV